MNNNQPIAIGGLGGSGTRLFAQIMYLFDVYMGNNINDTDDNLFITFLFKRKEILNISKNDFNIFFNIFEKKIFGIELNRKERKIIKYIYNNKTKQDYLYDRDGTFRDLLNKTVSKKFTNWGWKEPNTHILLPFLLKRYPRIKYIHIMRNGLDMAFSKNKNQIKFWTNYKPTPKNMLHYWTKIHKKVFKLQKKYPDNIIIIDYDNFCLNPDKNIPKLLNFLNFTKNDDIIKEIKSIIKIPKTIDRYKSNDMTQFNDTDLEFVKKLGYIQ